MKTLLTRIEKRADWERHKLFDVIYRRFVKPPCVMTYGQCVDFVLANRASICRFGDGELGVIRGRALGFQMQDGCLGERLRRVLMTDVEGLLTCIPDTFEKLDRYTPVEQNFWKAHHYYNRKSWMRLLVPGKRYGNTFLSRFYSMEFDKSLSADRLGIVRKLWNGRDVIFVEGKDTKLGSGNDLFDNAKSIRRVICPSKNAFSKYSQILSAVKSIDRDENNLFILALGPTATVLAADIHAAGLQALDFGHIDIEYEWFRQGVKTKTPVVGKFSNEAAILGLAKNPVTGNISCPEYINQIIMDLTV